MLKRMIACFGLAFCVAAAGSVSAQDTPRQLPDEPCTAAPDQPKYQFPKEPCTAAPDQPKYQFPKEPCTAAPDQPKYQFPKEPCTAAPDQPKYQFPKEPCTAVQSGIEGKATKHVLQGIPGPRKAVPLDGVEIIVRDAKTGKEVTRAKTDKNGNFKLHLDAGEYKLESKSGTWTFNQKVKVTKDKWSTVDAQFKHHGLMPPGLPRPGRIPASGVSGTALQYPVFGNAPTFPVPPTKVAGVFVVATDVKTGKEVARVQTGPDGKFSLALPAGEYKLSASNGKHWQYSETVKVKAFGWEKVNATFKYTGPPIPSAGGPTRR